MKKKTSLALTLSIIALISPAADAEQLIKCPEYFAPSQIPSVGIPDATAVSFNGQYLQRVDPVTLEINNTLKGVIGCYRFFSKNTGVDALWDIGVITFINSDYYWLNAAGSKWKLLPDFENSIFSTDSSNPYYAYSKEFAITSPQALKKLPSGECKMKNNSGSLGLGFPLPARRISQEKAPKILAVLIDFNTRIANDISSEMKRFKFDKVEEFFLENSFGYSKLDIKEHSEIVYVNGKPEDYLASSGNSSLLSEAYAALKKTTDLSVYAGYIFVTSQNGPEFSSGYAGMLGGLTQVAADHSIPFVWMGGKDPQNIQWVELWKMVAHEVGHMYGLPDLYMTQGSNQEGKTAGPFDLMDGIGGKANSLNFMHKWMLGWIPSTQVKCHLPNESPVTYLVSPVALAESDVKGLIIPLSSVEALLVEVRVASKYDSLLPSQEGVVVYYMDTRKPSGSGPLRLIPALNPFTANKSIMDDVDRFLEGALRVDDFITESGITVHSISRKSNLFEVTIAKGDEYPRLVAERKIATAKAMQEKQAAESASLAQKNAKKTIICVKGKSVKKISGKNPQCPTGYKLRK